MKFWIHFEWSDGTEDKVLIEGETTQEVRQKADAWLEEHGGKNPWSEEIGGK